MYRDSQPMQRRTVLKTIGGTAIAGGVVGGMSGSAAARRGKVYNLTFNKDDDAAEYTATDPGWQVDRTEPDELVRVTGQPRNNSLNKNIDETKTTDGFFSFQGFRYVDAGGVSWGREIPRRLRGEGTIYIDPEWEENDEKARTGLWYALGDGPGDKEWTWFEIIEYRSSAVTGSDPGFFRFGSEDGYEGAGTPTRLDTPSNMKGGWISTQLTVEPGNNETDIAWKVNGQTLLEDTFGNPFGDTCFFSDFWINSVNFGKDQDYYYDNFKVTVQ